MNYLYPFFRLFALNKVFFEYNLVIFTLKSPHFNAMVVPHDVTYYYFDPQKETRRKTAGLKYFAKQLSYRFNS